MTVDAFSAGGKMSRVVIGMIGTTSIRTECNVEAREKLTKSCKNIAQ